MAGLPVEENTQSTHTAQRPPQLNLTIVNARCRYGCLCPGCQCDCEIIESDSNADIHNHGPSNTAEAESHSRKWVLTDESSMDTETELNEQDHSRLRFPHHEDTEGLADRTAILHPHHHRHDGQLTLLASEGENPMTDSTAWNLGDSSDGDGLIDFLFTLREHPRNRPSSPTDSLYNNYDSNSGGESMTS